MYKIKRNDFTLALQTVIQSIFSYYLPYKDLGLLSGNPLGMNLHILFVQSSPTLRSILSVVYINSIRKITSP